MKRLTLLMLCIIFFSLALEDTIAQGTVPWWNINWSHRISMVLANHNGPNRIFEPIDVHLEFPDSVCTNATKEVRVILWTGTQNIEVVSQVYNETYSEGKCVSANVVWLANISAGELSTYYIYVGNPDAEYPNYSGYMSTVNNTNLWGEGNTGAWDIYFGDNLVCTVWNRGFYDGRGAAFRMWLNALPHNETGIVAVFDRYFCMDPDVMEWSNSFTEQIILNYSGPVFDLFTIRSREPYIKGVVENIIDANHTTYVWLFYGQEPQLKFRWHVLFVKDYSFDSWFPANPNLMRIWIPDFVWTLHQGAYDSYSRYDGVTVNTYPLWTKDITLNPGWWWFGSMPALGGWHALWMNGSAATVAYYGIGLVLTEPIRTNRVDLDWTPGGMVIADWGHVPVYWPGIAGQNLSASDWFEFSGWITQFVEEPPYSTQPFEIFVAAISDPLVGHMSVGSWVTPLQSDEIPPTITNIDYPSVVTSDQNATITAVITDDMTSIQLAKLEYSVDNGVTWISVAMTREGALYKGVIPKQTSGTQVIFKIVATDEAGNEAISDTKTFSVIQNIQPLLDQINTLNNRIQGLTDTVDALTLTIDQMQATISTLQMVAYAAVALSILIPAILVTLYHLSKGKT